MRYIISDIHGCLDEFLELLDKIGLSDSDHLYVLGDAIDRGEDPIGVMQMLMKMDNLTYLAGNHDMYLHHIVKRFGYGLRGLKGEEDKKVLQYWLDDGGLPTMLAFIRLPEHERERISGFIENASFYEQLEHDGIKFVLAHAGIYGFEEERPLEDYAPEDFIYGRTDYSSRLFKKEDTWLVTGHTPTPFIRDDNRPLAYKANGHIAVDCGCVYGGQLAAYCIETGETIYVAKK